MCVEGAHASPAGALSMVRPRDCQAGTASNGLIHFTRLVCIVGTPTKRYKNADHTLGTLFGGKASLWRWAAAAWQPCPGHSVCCGVRCSLLGLLGLHGPECAMPPLARFHAAPVMRPRRRMPQRQRLRSLLRQAGLPGAQALACRWAHAAQPGRLAMVCFPGQHCWQTRRPILCKLAKGQLSWVPAGCRTARKVPAGRPRADGHG